MGGAITARYSIDEIRDIITPIAQKYGAERIFLFGSYARGEAGDGSDVDLRIDKGEIFGLFALAGLYTEIEAALKTKVDLLTTDSLDKQFLEKIQPEEVLLYENQY